MRRAGRIAMAGMIATRIDLGTIVERPFDGRMIAPMIEPGLTLSALPLPVSEQVLSSAYAAEPLSLGTSS